MPDQKNSAVILGRLCHVKPKAFMCAEDRNRKKSSKGATETKRKLCTELVCTVELLIWLTQKFA